MEARNKQNRSANQTEKHRVTRNETWVTKSFRLKIQKQWGVGKHGSSSDLRMDSCIRQEFLLSIYLS